MENSQLDAILGLQKAKNLIMTALVARRNILIVGPPGTGKTTVAKNIAKIMPKQEVFDCAFNCSCDNPGCPDCIDGKSNIKKIIKNNFIRVQGSPDLVVEDLIGDIDPNLALKFGPSSIKAFKPGKIFKANCGVLFFDEINRCPEKLQNSLLQVLEEKKVTLGSFTMDIPVNFIFVATMNPEDTSTEKLSEVLLDRFEVVHMDYPETANIEMQIVRKHTKPVVEIPNDVLKTITDIVRQLRRNPDLEKKPSVRATIGLYECSAGHAKIMGRDKATMDDLQAVLDSVLSHRIKVKPSLKFIKKPSDIIKEESRQFFDKSQSEEGDVP
jgi:Mg-chelatase subunit ChlI